MQPHSKETTASCVDGQPIFIACPSGSPHAVTASFNSRSLAAEKKKIAVCLVPSSIGLRNRGAMRMLRYVTKSLNILRAVTRVVLMRVDTHSPDLTNAWAHPCSDACFLLGGSSLYSYVSNSLRFAGAPLISRPRSRLSDPSKIDPSSPLQYAAQTFVIINRPCPSATE